MESKSKIEQKIEEAMNSLDNISHASPLPFFYTRLEARMLREETNVWSRVGQFLSRPAIAFVSVGLVLVLNTFVFIKHNSPNTISIDQQEVAAADEYNRTTSTFNYNIDNVQP